MSCGSISWSDECREASFYVLLSLPQLEPSFRGNAELAHDRQAPDDPSVAFGTENYEVKLLVAFDRRPITGRRPVEFEI